MAAFIGTFGRPTVERIVLYRASYNDATVSNNVNVAIPFQTFLFVSVHVIPIRAKCGVHCDTIYEGNCI